MGVVLDLLESRTVKITFENSQRDTNGNQWAHALGTHIDGYIIRWVEEILHHVGWLKPEIMG